MLRIDAATLYAERDRLADTLFAHRKDREPPLRDEKIFTAWNGLMISAFAGALLTLYDITGNTVWLERAEELTAAMLALFWDPEKGGFFMAPAVESTAALFVRPQDLYDASMPTGNAVAMRVLLRLFKRTGNPEYSEYADKLINFFAGAFQQRTEIRILEQTKMLECPGTESNRPVQGADTGIFSPFALVTALIFNNLGAVN